MAQASDKRVERSKTAVLAETYRQLKESGISGVSIDEVSRVSGVSKTTIYRHWSSRSALLIDACSRLGNTHDVPDTGTLIGDIRAVATHLAEQLPIAAWACVYPSIIDAAERDPEIAKMQSELHKRFMTPLNAIVERARLRGEIRPGLAAADLIAAVVGPLFYRRWFSKEAIDEPFVNAITATAIKIAAGK